MVEDESHGPCNEEFGCMNDLDCPWDTKCCNTSCGYQCIEPGNMINPLPDDKFLTLPN